MHLRGEKCTCTYSVVVAVAGVEVVWVVWLVDTIEISTDFVQGHGVAVVNRQTVCSRPTVGTRIAILTCNTHTQEKAWNSCKWIMKLGS